LTLFSAAHSKVERMLAVYRARTELLVVLPARIAYSYCGVREYFFSVTATVRTRA
jgi:hypothetical protein